MTDCDCQGVHSNIKANNCTCSKPQTSRTRQTKALQGNADERLPVSTESKIK
ncbi:hypothetical protein X777_10017 [Ooceraea biroi]|uniref:Uncharacterized protein n=1 Tax=Ooceraea biroi TaxID=2015173 RepID=A0A026W5I0_OOCBI|nr:hypothetical protein X777_10017 [Ooceraea biroi]